MMTPKQRGHLLTFDVGSLVNRFDGDNVAVIFAPIHRGGICLPDIIGIVFGFTRSQRLWFKSC